MPRAPPLRDGKIFLEAGEAGELTWRERKLARGQLAFLLCGQKKMETGGISLEKTETWSEAVTGPPVAQASL